MCSLPTCSAFSTLRRIFEALSGNGNSSSWPASGWLPARKIYDVIVSHETTSTHNQSANLWAEGGMLKHDGAISELLHQTVFSLDSYQHGQYMHGKWKEL